ncbi:MAG: hypothetical protein AAB367_01185 [Patescibacteria group bacterium]|mgnify:CR=1 FL=1
MLLEFYGLECPHCESMKPLVEKLRKEGVAVESFEVWHDKNNLAKLQEYDKGYCGGVPFFINPQTGKWICGEASYEELKNIAQ